MNDAAFPYTIVSLTPENLAQHPEAVCFTKTTDSAFAAKQNWLLQRFAEGLRLKLVYEQGAKKPIGYIEYTDGENAWRRVQAKGYLFIHCLWVSSKVHRGKGIASRLLDACLADAQRSGFAGVAVLCSGDAYLADRDVFLKNGFEVCATAPPKFELLVKSCAPAPLPSLDVPAPQELASYQGWHIIYSDQCPWVSRFVAELITGNHAAGLDLSTHKLETANDAQRAPSLYAVFNLVHDGRLLADHYISLTRWQNIIRKELAGKVRK